VRVIDSAGHINYSNNVTVYFDNTQAPNVSIFYPPNNGVVNNTLTINVSANSTAGINNVNITIYTPAGALVAYLSAIQYSVSGSQITNWSNVSYDISGLADGWYNLTARANDSIGKSNKSANVSSWWTTSTPTCQRPCLPTALTSTAHSRSRPSQ